MLGLGHGHQLVMSQEPEAMAKLLVRAEEQVRFKEQPTELKSSLILQARFNRYRKPLYTLSFLGGCKSQPG